jgi:hypothetical protein
MTDELNSDDRGPSEEAIDTIESIKRHTALEIFKLNIHRIQAILKAAETGIKDDIVQIDQIHEKFSNPRPQSKIGIVKEKFKRLEDGSIEIEFTDKEVSLVKMALYSYRKFNEHLPFYLYNILLAAVWGALEGYVQAMLAEVYSQHPRLFSSEKKVTVAEMLDFSDNVIAYLVAKEIDDVGRKNFGDLQLYLKAKIKLQFSNAYLNGLYDAYFLRNVIAHSAGFLRPDQLSLVPEGVNTNGLELRISKDYLNDLIDCIRGAVLELDQNVRSKFPMAEQAALLPPEGLEEPAPGQS